jgi:ribose transport system permease protein
MSKAPRSDREEAQVSDAPAGNIASYGQTPRRGAISTLVRRAEIDLIFLVVFSVTLAITLSFASPFFLTSRNIGNVLLQASVLAILSCGMTIVIISGNFDLSVGSGLALSMVTTALVMQYSDSIPLGVVAGLSMGVAIGVINGIVVTMLRVPSFIATLGMLVIARGAARGITGGRTVFGLPEGFFEFMNGKPLGVGLIVWVAAAVFVLLHLILRYSYLGVYFYAVGGNPQAARVGGLQVRRIQLLAFVLCGMTMGVAGVALLGRLGSGQPNSGALLELFAVAAVVLGGTSLYGGRGSLPRTLVGVLLIAMIENGLNLMNVNPDLQLVALGLVFIGATASGLLYQRKE